MGSEMFIPPKKDDRKERGYEEPRPLYLELPLPPPPAKKKEDEKTKPERGIWTIDI